MNSKMIAIIAVVAMCGAALVGVGYAYTATLETNDITIDSTKADVKYITLTSNAQESAVSLDFRDITLDYNYSKVGNGKATFTLANAVGGTEQKKDFSSNTTYEAYGTGNAVEVTLRNTIASTSYTVYIKALATPEANASSSTAVSAVAFSYTANGGVLSPISASDSDEVDKAKANAGYTHKVVLPAGTSQFTITLGLTYTLVKEINDGTSVPTGLTIAGQSAATMQFFVEQTESSQQSAGA